MQDHNILSPKQMAMLYSNNTKKAPQAHLALFVTKPNLNVKELVAFKKQIQAELLIAIVTDDEGYTCQQIADKIIYCEASEVANLLNILNSIDTKTTLLNIDIGDILEYFKQANFANFTSFTTTLDKLEHSLQGYKNKQNYFINNSPLVKNLVTYISAHEDFSFFDLENISQAISPLSLDQSKISYSITLSAQQSFYQIANLAFWQDDSLPKILPNAVINQLPLTTKEVISAILPLQAKQNKSVDENAIHLLIGTDKAQNAVYLNLVNAKHLLIKDYSNVNQVKLLHTLLVSILMQYKPEQLKLLFINGKTQIFKRYQTIPHLISPNISHQNIINTNITWCQSEMERRLDLLKRANVQDFNELNQKIKEAKQLSRLMASYKLTQDTFHFGILQQYSIFESLPRIVVFISELREILLDKTSAHANLLQALISKGDKVGIHLILTTNNPYIDMPEGILKFHIPTRITFKMDVVTEAKALLGFVGTESLANNEMLFSFNKHKSPITLNTLFATESEISQVIDSFRSKLLG